MIVMRRLLLFIGFILFNSAFVAAQEAPTSNEAKPNPALETSAKLEAKPSGENFKIESENKSNTLAQKPAGTRPIPKIGVREAKIACRSQGKLGKDLFNCIREKMVP